MSTILLAMFLTEYAVSEKPHRDDILAHLSQNNLFIDIFAEEIASLVPTGRA